jgi:hypothetical protein
MRGLDELRTASATRPPPRFRSCSTNITAYHPAVTEQLGALTAAEGKGTVWKQKLPIDPGADGSAAYIVVPALYRHDQHARRVQENGILTVALRKAGQRWRITAFAWTKQ